MFVETGQRLQIRKDFSIFQLDIRRGEEATDMPNGGVIVCVCVVGGGYFVSTRFRPDTHTHTLAWMSIVLAHRQPGERRAGEEKEEEKQSFRG